MGGTGKALVFLTEEEVLETNRRIIERFGGIYLEGDKNLANPGSLRYVLEMIQGSFFGFDPYPTVFEKAAALAWHTIRAHVFHDGNKRTGMEICRHFLEDNGFTMTIDRDTVDIALQVAQGDMNFEQFTQWVKSKTSKSR